MFGQPWYRGYPSNASYDPYQYSPFQQPSPFASAPRRTSGFYGVDEAAQDRARLLAERRARRAQYLPDEVDEDEDDWEYNQLGPRERAYLEAQRRRAILERKQEEEALARQRELEEKEWQAALDQRQREDEEVRQRLLEERKRQLRMKREEEARLIAAEREKVRQQQAMAKAQRDRSQSQGNGHPPAPSHHEDTSIPIKVHRSSTSSPPPSSPSKSSIPIHESKTPSPPSSRPATPPSALPSKYSLEEQNEAAARIQTLYRIHSSQKNLDKLHDEFETLKKNFVYPSAIDFQNPSGEGHIRVLACRAPSDFDTEDGVEPMDVDGPEGKLDFTSTNYALNAYSDALDKLLMRLDGVESWGKKDIREKRRTIVKSIEREASKLDRYWKQAWLDHLAKQTSAQ